MNIVALNVLETNLRSNPIIDNIVAGILISKNYKKTLTVLKRISYCRKLVHDLGLKKEGVLMMYKNQLERLAFGNDISKNLSLLSDLSPSEFEEPSVPNEYFSTKKRDLKLVSKTHLHKPALHIKTSSS